MNEQFDVAKILQEFHQKQNSLTTGYLVLIDNQIHYFENEKDWKQQKESLLSQNRLCFNLVNLELYHNWKNNQIKSQQTQTVN
ncbi:MAG: hypothetical protein GBAus27B_000598 [Mycoplasmataceae bacterium]|nr:MAG: hypothetical protein GBAus27B_000598 [Mycoplasmataceae bacterium]